jgi:regulator of protease activity HflC (stomatin/prohibitin superfamily)
MEDALLNLLENNLVFLLLAALFIVLVFKSVKIVPQSEQHVIERFGRLRAVLGPGINLIVPFIDHVAHMISILERQLPTASQDAITRDNVLVQVETSVFYRITEPEKTVYRIRDVDSAIAEGGLEAAQYQIALKQVEALSTLGTGDGKQTIVVPAAAMEAFGDAFKLLQGRVS